MTRTFRSEAFSFFTHLGGALAGVAALGLLLARAEGAAEVAATAVYGLTMVAMFATSALHHVTRAREGIFRRLDMTAIYLFIAGTYTPFCVLVLPSRLGWAVLALVWTLALAGIVLRWLRPVTPAWLTIGLYLGLGWMGALGAIPVYAALSWSGIALLVGGGVVYTVGAIVYATRRPDPWPDVVGYHGLWHVFVLVAVALHFALVWRVAA